MTFEEILDQAVAMLQRRGRLTYGALKRQFQLDDAYLDDLKAELIEGQRVAVDEDGRVLVWTGNVEGTIATSSPPPQSIPLPLTQDTPFLQPASSVLTSRIPEAERRQLTVMLCDLVGSTQLASQLDPEDWRDVVRAYQQVCTDVIQRYDGHIAQLLGDGLLVYFGYPQAHEDDAQRAVRAGLGMLAALGDLNTGLQQAKGVQLAIRVGVHTGLVVVGEMGGAGRQEQLALGEVPNVCSRIEALAAPNTVAVSDATYRLVQGYFACQDLGAHALRGVPESMRLYQVLGASGATSRLDVAQPRGLTPLVGRESEVTLLRERWQQATAGHGQVVLLSGEAGIGKSRLVQTLKDHVAHAPHARWECRSSEYSQNTALYPVTDLFHRLFQFHAEDTPDTKLEKLEHALSHYRLPVEETVPLFASVLSLPCAEERYAPLALSPQRQRQKTLETLVAILLELAERQPVLFILEDLHWTDPTTLEFLGLLVEQVPTTAIATLLTCRPHFQPSWHHRSYITEMTLNHLSHAQAEQIVTGMTDGKTFPAEVLQQILAKTNGVPLFIEEMTKALLQSGQLTALDGHYALVGSLSTLTIPATLHDSLMARLDRLVTAKAVAQYAAVIGRQFPYALLQVVSQLDEATLRRELGRLVEAEIVYQRGVPPQATYTFKHALIQDAAYQSLLRSTRQQYHQHIAQMLAEQFPETVETQPELLAYHSTEAGLGEQAVLYWQRAGQQALQRSMNVEAINHLTKGLALLTTLPETPASAQHELTLLLTLGAPLMVTKGQAAPEVERVYTRARALCQQLGATSQTFPVLWGLWMFSFIRAELETARALGAQLLELAQGVHDPALVLEGHHALWPVLFLLGELLPARTHWEQGMALYDLHEHGSLALFYGGHDPGACCQSYAALALWLLGYPEQAVQRSQAALILADELSHPYSRALTLVYAAWLHLYRRERHAVHERTEALMALATEQGFALLVAWGTLVGGWILAEQGQGEDGIAQIRRGLAAHGATGAAYMHTNFLALLAETYGKAGQAEEGLRVLSEALAIGEKNGERFYEAELYRLQGELTLQKAGVGDGEQGTSVTSPHTLSPTSHAFKEIVQEAEGCFLKAMDIARGQQAKSLELRAATSVARLWQRQGKRTEAHELLAPLYAWFTEGFDTADLQEAKALLDALA